MTPTVTVDNPHYVEYIRLLLELHALMAQGNGETEAADELREKMVRPWTQLDPREMSRLRGLSADLYMLEGDELPEHVEPAERSPQRLTAGWQAAWNAKDWDELLALLRIGLPFLDQAQVAYLRGRCWAELRHPEVALLFFDHAARRNPQFVNYRVLAIESLMQLGRLPDALDWAHRIVADETADPRLLFKAADVLLRSAETMSEEDARERLGAVIDVIRRALQKETTLPEKERITEVTVAAHAELGYCFEHRGQTDAAIDAYRRALELGPRHPAFLLRALDILQQKRKLEAAALEDLKERVSPAVTNKLDEILLDTVPAA